MDLPWLVLTATALGSALLTPLVRRLAVRSGAVDRPGIRHARGVHKRPLPRLGGLAIFIAFAVAALVAVGLKDSGDRGILLGGLLIIIVGAIDDFRPLSAKVKLVFQIAAALVLVFSGVQIHEFTNPLGGLIFLGVWSIPLTVIWVVGLINVVNFIDGLDGLAAGVCSIASLTLLFVALKQGQVDDVVLAAALAGATLGFLPFNFNPARIIMGDSGSMFLGYALAAISVDGLVKSATTVGLVVPVLAMGLPIFDGFFAIVRRSINHRPVYEADRGHVHHRLLDLGLSQKQAVLVLYGVSGLFSAGAILFTEVSPARGLIVLTVLVAAVFVVARRLGVLEIRTGTSGNQGKHVKG
ncbi:MAG TPA: MraY family glycosyltransferase [Bacillota bacterium]